MATNQREDDNVTILCRKFQAHVEMILEEFIVKTKKNNSRIEKITETLKNCQIFK